MLLHSLECSDDAGITAVKKDISTLEAALKKLSQQEEKYTAELNDALPLLALREKSVEKHVSWWYNYFDMCIQQRGGQTMRLRRDK